MYIKGIIKKNLLKCSQVHTYIRINTFNEFDLNWNCIDFHLCTQELCACSQWQLIQFPLSNAKFHIKYFYQKKKRNMKGVRPFHSFDLYCNGENLGMFTRVGKRFCCMPRVDWILSASFQKHLHCFWRPCYDNLASIQKLQSEKRWQKYLEIALITFVWHFLAGWLRSGISFLPTAAVFVDRIQHCLT